jgi:ParB family chromosome partitioning protein
MSKKHDAIFDDVLGGLDEAASPKETQKGTRFLKRSTTIGDRLSGELEEKTLHWVDPADCVMWDHHNRAYDLLSEDNCRDLIDGIKAQGRQEFPAIVRKRDGQGGAKYEVICGARRHFAISWLRANNYPNFKYLIELRDLSDEEAFRLADIENRDREDISDYERASDYAQAVKTYYSGKQRVMAERLEVSEAWLSRYLQLAKLDKPIVDAFPTIRDIRELHARQLKPLMKTPGGRGNVLAEARAIAEAQKDAREGRGVPLDAAQVMARLKQATSKPKPKKQAVKTYRSHMAESGVQLTQKGKRVRLEFDANTNPKKLEKWLEMYLADHTQAFKPEGDDG